MKPLLAKLCYHQYCLVMPDLFNDLMPSYILHFLLEVDAFWDPCAKLRGRTSTPIDYIVHCGSIINIIKIQFISKPLGLGIL